MTKKHFEIIARIVKRIADTNVRKDVALQFVLFCQTNNKNFDHQRFLVACGIDNNK